MCYSGMYLKWWKAYLTCSRPKVWHPAMQTVATINKTYKQQYVWSDNWYHNQNTGISEPLPNPFHRAFRIKQSLTATNYGFANMSRTAYKHNHMDYIVQRLASVSYAFHVHSCLMYYKFIPFIAEHYSIVHYTLRSIVCNVWSIKT